MLQIIKDPLLSERGILWGMVEVRYPDPDLLREEAFYARAEEKLAELKAAFPEYDRKAVFGDNPYTRFFKKFKKTFPVLLQFESVLFKDRPFPHGDPVAELPFLAEIETRMLMGAHDAGRVEGPIRLCLAKERESFSGMRGEAHCYPDDVVGKDDGGIILSMISGADDRTCIHPDTSYVFYPTFGTPGLPKEELERAQDVLCGYINLLSPEAEVERVIV